MSEPTDIEKARNKKRKGDDDSEMIWECPECACGLFWCPVESPIQCANCGCMAENVMATEIA